MLKLPTSQINNLTRCLRNSLKLQVHKVDFEVVFAEREKEWERERSQLNIEHVWIGRYSIYILEKIFLFVSLSFNVNVKKMRLIEFAERNRNQVIKHPEIFRALTAFLPTHVDYWVRYLNIQLDQCFCFYFVYTLFKSLNVKLEKPRYIYIKPENLSDINP